METTQKEQMEVAQMRFGVIAPLVQGTYTDAPMQFIGQKVEVRFLPGDTDSAYILYGGRHYPLRLTDRVANGRTKRQTAISIDYTKEGQKDVY